jgi:POT family proton-dependent oligopeptide transporter
MITGLFLVLSLFGWYSLGWGYGCYFLFLTVIIGLMMMIYETFFSTRIKIVS